MSDVIDLEERLRVKHAAVGETQFLLCGCGANCGVFPLICFDARGAFIVAMVCPACDNEIPVSYGRLEGDVRPAGAEAPAVVRAANDTGGVQEIAEGVIEEPKLES